MDTDILNVKKRVTVEHGTFLGPYGETGEDQCLTHILVALTSKLPFTCHPL